MSRHLSQAHYENAAQIDVVQRAKALIASKDPHTAALVKKANLAMRERFLTPNQVHNDSTLSNMSVQFKNPDYIGLGIMPVLPVDKLSNRYATYGKGDRLAAPEDEIGARSVPNEIAETRSFATYACRSFALMDYLDVTTVNNQDEPLDEMVDLVAAVNDAIDFREELRIAALVQNPATYVGNTAALAGASRWDTSTGDPIKDVKLARRALWSGLGATKLVGYCSDDVVDAMLLNPAVVDKMKYTTPGVPTEKILAGLLGLDDILVGRARKRTSNVNQTAVYGKIWGKGFGIARVATRPGPRTACFGLTFRMGRKKTFQWFDQKTGVDGGYYAKVGMHEDHGIVAPETGFYFETVIS
jgi:hypothetical protein